MDGENRSDGESITLLVNVHQQLIDDERGLSVWVDDGPVALMEFSTDKCGGVHSPLTFEMWGAPLTQDRVARLYVRSSIHLDLPAAVTGCALRLRS